MQFEFVRTECEVDSCIPRRTTEITWTNTPPLWLTVLPVALGPAWVCAECGAWGVQEQGTGSTAKRTNQLERVAEAISIT
jgi:hypothetical protein